MSEDKQSKVNSTVQDVFIFCSPRHAAIFADELSGLLYDLSEGGQVTVLRYGISHKSKGYVVLELESTFGIPDSFFKALNIDQDIWDYVSYSVPMYYTESEQRIKGENDD